MTVKSGLVVKTQPPLPMSVNLSLQISVLLYGGGKISIESMSGINHVSLPIMMSVLYVEELDFFKYNAVEVYVEET